MHVFSDVWDRLPSAARDQIAILEAKALATSNVEKKVNYHVCIENYLYRRRKLCFPGRSSPGCCRHAGSRCQSCIHDTLMISTLRLGFGRLWACACAAACECAHAQERDHNTHTHTHTLPSFALRACWPRQLSFFVQKERTLRQSLKSEFILIDFSVLQSPTAFSLFLMFCRADPLPAPTTCRIHPLLLQSRHPSSTSPLIVHSLLLIARCSLMPEIDDENAAPLTMSIAGTCCQPFSPMGKSQKQADPRHLPWVLWTTERLIHQEDIICFENSDRFPVEMHVAKLASTHRSASATHLRDTLPVC